MGLIGKLSNLFAQKCAENTQYQFVTSIRFLKAQQIKGFLGKAALQKKIMHRLLVLPQMLMLFCSLTEQSIKKKN